MRTVHPSRPLAVLGLFILFTLTPLRADDPSSLPAPEHAETLDLIALVNDAAAAVEEEGAAACEQFRRPDGPWRYDETYVFLFTMDGTTLCHPERPSFEGKSLLEIHDADGKPIVEMFVRELADQETAWVHYLWPRPGSSVLSWKSSYVRRVEGPVGDDGDRQAMIVGSGAYDLPLEKLFIVDRVDAAASLLEAEGRAAFPTLRDKAAGFLFLDAYIFVMSTEGTMLVHPLQPELEGKPALQIRDPDGTHPGVQMLRVLEDRDAGWVGYLWPKPGDEALARKETYVRKVVWPGTGGVDGETWIVGAGVYLDD